MAEANLLNEENPVAEETAQKWVYLFEEGSGDDKSLLGGKGAGLCEMTRAGLPVPPGLIVTTEACNAFFDNDKKFPEGMWEQVKEGLQKIEEKVGKRFGDPQEPAAGFSPFRRGVLDAGNDGHGAEPRSERRDGAGSG